LEDISYTDSGLARFPVMDDEQPQPVDVWTGNQRILQRIAYVTLNS